MAPFTPTHRRPGPAPSRSSFKLLACHWQYHCPAVMASPAGSDSEPVVRGPGPGHPVQMAPGITDSALDSESRADERRARAAEGRA